MQILNGNTCVDASLAFHSRNGLRWHRNRRFGGRNLNQCAIAYTNELQFSRRYKRVYRFLHARARNKISKEAFQFLLIRCNDAIQIPGD